MYRIKVETRRAGRFADVFTATDESGEDRLLKVLKIDAEGDVRSDRARERMFANEWYVQDQAWSLDPRHFAKVFAYDRELRIEGDLADELKGRPAIVMELVSGPTLGEVISSLFCVDNSATGEEARGALREIRASYAIEVGCHLLDATRVIHSLRYCHQDIRPANVIVDLESGVPRIIDFGSATSMSRCEVDVVIQNAYSNPREVGRVDRAPLPTVDVYPIAKIVRELAFDVRPDQNSPLPSCELSEWVARSLANDGLTADEALRELQDLAEGLRRARETARGTHVTGTAGPERTGSTPGGTVAARRP